MFSYAARTILSKTLRRILQKYLVDVNIDEVALGGENGWGVVVKNVELREGAVLFSFPVKTSLREEKSKSTIDGGTSIIRKEVNVKEKETLHEKERSKQINEINEDVNLINNAVSTLEKKECNIENESIFQKEVPEDIFRNEKSSTAQKSQQLLKSQTFCFYRRKRSLKEENQPNYLSDIGSSGSFYDDVEDCNENHHFREALDNKDTVDIEHQAEDLNINESNLRQQKSKPEAENFENNDDEEKLEMHQTIEFRVGKGGSIGNLGIRYV